MHIETLGSGPSLVLLHGWALHGGVFAPLVQRLSDRYTLHLVDLPGHGFSRDSEVPLALDATVHAILARTPPAAWLAWSLGGLFALQAAASSPRVRGLAMVAATPRFVRDGDWAHAVEGRVLAQFGDDLRNDYAGTANAPLGQYAGPGDPYTYPISVPGSSNQQNYGVTLQADWNLPFATLTYLGAIRNDIVHTLAGSGRNYPYGTPRPANGCEPTLNLGCNTIYFDSKERQETHELRLGSSEGAFKWVAGLYYFEERNNVFANVFPAVAFIQPNTWPMGAGTTACPCHHLPSVPGTSAIRTDPAAASRCVPAAVAERVLPGASASMTSTPPEISRRGAAVRRTRAMTRPWAPPTGATRGRGGPAGYSFGPKPRIRYPPDFSSSWSSRRPSLRASSSSSLKVR